MGFVLYLVLLAERKVRNHLIILQATNWIEVCNALEQDYNLGNYLSQMSPIRMRYSNVSDDRQGRFSIESFVLRG